MRSPPARPKIQKNKNALHWLTGITVMLILGFGIFESVHSSLFYLKTVKVEAMSSGYPLTEASVLELAKVPIGKISLFDLHLAPIEARLMQHPWIKGVIVGKQFPNTVSLKIVERTPVAVLNELSGRVLYVEADGTSFQDVSMNYPKDLPFLKGFNAQNIDQLKKMNHFIETWFSLQHFPGLRLSELSFDDKLGLRAVVSYPLKNQKQMRSVLELGLNIEEASLIPSQRLLKILDYLANHSMPASKIWLGDGKKIVVKVARGP